MSSRKDEVVKANADNASGQKLPRLTKARRAALDLLFEAEARGLDAIELVDDRVAHPVSEKLIRDYTIEIVKGVTENRERIDELLATYSTGWPVERMPGVDRQALRMGIWEMLFNDEIPDNVAIDEAVTAVAEMSTDESPNFVSGLLNRIKDLKPALID